MTLSKASEWWQYNNSEQQYNPALFITILRFFFSLLFNFFPYLYRRPPSVRILLYFFRFHFAHTATLILFDYYCYLYDFVALLKIQLGCEFIIFASRLICSQSDRHPHPLTHSSSSCIALECFLIFCEVNWQCFYHGIMLLNLICAILHFTTVIIVVVVVIILFIKSCLLYSFK